MPTSLVRFLPRALLLVCGFAAAFAQDDKIDWTLRRHLHQRAQQGEKLNADDQACYEKAKAALMDGKGPSGESRPAPVPVDTSKLVPR